MSTDGPARPEALRKLIAREPTLEDRRYGWIDADEFARWLNTKRAVFPGKPGTT